MYCAHLPYFSLCQGQKSIYRSVILSLCDRIGVGVECGGTGDTRTPTLFEVGGMVPSTFQTRTA